MTPDPEHSHKYISDWIALEAGEFYKIEGYAMEWSGSDHFTTSVEFEKADTTGHHHARKEIQVLSMVPTQTYEKFVIKVNSYIGNNYKVLFYNPLYNSEDKNSFLTWTSDNIADDASANTVRDKIQGYFQSVWGSNIYVTKTDHDVDDAVTTDSELAVSSYYEVQLRKLVSLPSYESAVIIGDADAVIGTQT